MLSICSFVVMTGIFSSCCQDGSKTELQSYPRDSWMPMLESTFATLDVRLNNFTPNRHEFGTTGADAYFKPNDCFFTIETPLGDIRREIAIPVIRRDPSSIYVDNLNSERVTFGIERNRFKISIFLEDEGREFWTNCVENAGCFAIGDRDVQVNNAQIDIFLVPTAADGGVSYSDVEVVLTSDISVSGCHDDLFAFLCDIFAPNRNNDIKDNIQNEFKTEFEANATRSLVSLLMTNYLRNVLGIDYEITSVLAADDGTLFLGRQVPCSE